MSGNVHIAAPAEYRSSGGVTYRARGPNSFARVFVSSTERDLKDYRQEVEDSLTNILQIGCFLGGRMSPGYVSTVEACMNEVDASGGFVGVFAYWYGSLPPGEPVSITHMEFNRALKRLEAEPTFPIAVFMPEDPSEAKSELEKRALDLLKDDEERRLHDERLKSFHQHVRGDWKHVRDFKTRAELGKWIIAICSLWQGLSPMEVVRGNVEVIGDKPGRRLPTEEELGLLGRDEHLKAVERALSEADDYPREPALAFLVLGGEDSGQRAFLQRLLKTEALSAGRPARIAQPTEQCDPASLVHLVAAGLGLTGAAGAAAPTTPAELAEAVHAGLQRQQLCFVLDQVHRVTGGVAAFREQFWLPLYQRLKELRAERPTEHRLLGFVADYTGGLGAEAAADPGDGEVPDYSRLQTLPALGDFEKEDVRLWLRAVRVPDNPPGKRSRIADVVVKNAQRQEDGTPLRVFDRLAREDLWPEGEER